MENKAESYRKIRMAYWDGLAKKMDHWQGWGKHYHERVISNHRHFIQPGARVLEIGCGHGDLLAAVSPRFGVGIDLSYEMVRRARAKHPDLVFVQADANDFPLAGPFDYIILSDLVNDLWDVQSVLGQIALCSSAQTRILINVQSQLWAPLLALAEKLNLAVPLINQNWLTPLDLRNLLKLEQYEVISETADILWPLGGKPIQVVANQFIGKFWPFKHLSLTNTLVSRYRNTITSNNTSPSVSIIVPARNEAGNIKSLIETIPDMGQFTEIIFVEGHSTDDTYDRIKSEISTHPEKRCLLFKQTGKGKSDAVKLGFEKASGDICMIYDADRTVPPEQLTRFYEALVEGTGELINGVRLVYPMENKSMRFLNLIGNKFFSLAISWLLGQPIKDTLCGTKALWRKDYKRIEKALADFGEFDPFGDFDLLFLSAKLGLKIIDLPIRYRERTYGETNINRWRHGAQLLRLLFIAASKLKFV